MDDRGKKPLQQCTPGEAVSTKDFPRVHGIQIVTGLARGQLAKGFHNNSFDGISAIIIETHFAFTDMCCVAGFSKSQEWLEEYLTDDRVTEWGQADSRVTFIAVAT